MIRTLSTLPCPLKQRREDNVQETESVNGKAASRGQLLRGQWWWRQAPSFQRKYLSKRPGAQSGSSHWPRNSTAAGDGSEGLRTRKC